MMRSAEYTAFARALEDAMCEKYDGELAMCTESAACSAIHYKSMSRIVGFNVRRNAKKTARIIRALILAAALALAGCAAMNLWRRIKVILSLLRTAAMLRSMWQMMIHTAST